LIFLDIDGVVNHHEWWVRRKAEGFSRKRKPYSTDELDPLVCKRLQEVCTWAKAEIVLISTWRKYCPLGRIRRVFAERGLTAPVIGRTPDLRHYEGQIEDHWQDVGRGLEIQWWLQHYLPSDEAVCEQRFVIIDDDRDMGDLLGKLTQPRGDRGLTDTEVPYLCKHLSETLMVSMAAGGSGRVLFKYDVRDWAPSWNQQRGPFGPEKV